MKPWLPFRTIEFLDLCLGRHRLERVYTAGDSVILVVFENLTLQESRSGDCSYKGLKKMLLPTEMRKSY